MDLRLPILALLALPSFAASNASAAEQADAPAVEDSDCSGSTLQMAQCANRNFERADRELDRLWKEIAADLERQDREFNDHREPRLAIAQRAQAAWRAYRDAQCAEEADAEARDGSMYPLVYIGCRTDMARERILKFRPLREEDDKTGADE